MGYRFQAQMFFRRPLDIVRPYDTPPFSEATPPFTNALIGVSPLQVRSPWYKSTKNFAANWQHLPGRPKLPSTTPRFPPPSSTFGPKSSFYTRTLLRAMLVTYMGFTPAGYVENIYTGLKIKDRISLDLLNTHLT